MLRRSLQNIKYSEVLVAWMGHSCTELAMGFVVSYLTLKYPKESMPLNVIL